MDDRVAETGRLRALRWMHAEVPRLALGMYFMNACLQDLQLWRGAVELYVGATSSGGFYYPPESNFSTDP